MKLKIYLYTDSTRKKVKKLPSYEFESTNEKCISEFKKIHDLLTKPIYSDIKYINVFDRVIFEKVLFKSVVLK